MITWGSDLLSDHGQVLLPLRQRLWIRWAPAEGVEHVEEGDGDVDEDDQRVERVWDQLMGTLLISRRRASTCLLLIFKIEMVLVNTTDNQWLLISLTMKIVWDHHRCVPSRSVASALIGMEMQRLEPDDPDHKHRWWWWWWWCCCNWWCWWWCCWLWWWCCCCLW